jgi:transcriptional regulator with PAS, ATPase and Fis domain
VDTRGFLLYANDLARNVLDIGRDVSCRDINFSELRKEVWPDYLKVIASGRPTENVTVEYPGFSLLSHRYPIVHKGEVIGIMSVFKLLKEYEELANSLFKTQEYADRIKAIIESSYDGIYVTDGKANTMLVNSAYEKITGLNASELIGRNMEDLVREGYFDESVSLKVISISRPFGNGGMICRT